MWGSVKKLCELSFLSFNEFSMSSLTVITAIYKYRHLVFHYSQDVIFLSNEQKMKLLQGLCKIMRNC